LYRATWDYAFHSVAYFELARISCIRGDFARALHQIGESISTNTRNDRVLSLKAAVMRKLGRFDDAANTLASLHRDDPLNFRAANEHYLVARESGRAEDARTILADLNQKMRDFDQNYLELAVGYLNEGMLAEAEDVLARFSGENPIVYYYRGFIAGQMGHADAAGEFYARAQELPEAGCFPFRLETVEVLKAALAFNAMDTKAHYYIGNILYDKQPEKAMEHWEKSIRNNPELAMAYRNLGWGYYRHYKDLSKAITMV
jgi:tetratricopeptide (TPR) repeat protein